MSDPRKKCLIIEDDRAIAELERDYLEMSDIVCTLAHDGAKGLRLALDEPFDIVVLDLMLPGADGYEICRSLRARKDIPILMVSARKEDVDKIRGLGLGADDYVTKPFSPSELTARVKAHLLRYERLTAASGNARQREIRVRGLSLLPDARRAALNGRELPLTAKEFDLLLFLAEHPDHVFSKDALMDKVWGFDYAGDTATVTVHVGKIREKLGEADATQYIETVWGAGYRFRA